MFKQLPVGQLLEKVAEAGYANVELVGEYKKWSEAEFREAKPKRKELKLQFDITAGPKHGVANPADREALLADVRNELPIMQEIDWPALVIMSGNVVPDFAGRGFRGRARSEPSPGSSAVRLLPRTNLRRKPHRKAGKEYRIHRAGAHCRSAGWHATGTGEIHYESIYRKLAQLKYDRMVAMEFMPLGDEVIELRTAREQALRFGSV